MRNDKLLCVPVYIGISSKQECEICSHSVLFLERKNIFLGKNKHSTNSVLVFLNIYLFLNTFQEMQEFRTIFKCLAIPRILARGI